MIEIAKEEKQQLIAKNIAVMLDAMCETTLTVNLGIGIPTLIVNYLDNEDVFIHTENGMVGVGPLAYGDEVHPDLVNAGRQPVKETPGCCYTDVAESFGMIRGGHMDMAVLGAFEVDRDANLANWIIPNTTLLGVGGAMDLAVGANTVIVAMTHTNGDEPKLVQQCKLPITGFGEVDYVVTEYGVFHFTEQGLVLEKKHPGITLEELQQITEITFAVAENLTDMVL